MGFKKFLASKLKKHIEDVNKPEVYQYEHLPIEFRRQVIHILVDCIGCYSSPDRSRLLPSLENQVWDKIHNSLARNLGEFCFGNVKDNPFMQCQYFLLDPNASFDNLLNFIEYTFCFIENDLPKIRQQRYYEFGETSYYFQSPDDAINELNHRFRQHNLGYQYNNGQIIRVDSDFVHAEVVVPALSLLSNHDFQGAEEEFRNAHKHYRKQEYKDAIVDCLNAFESTMKTIYKKSGWSYSDVVVPALSLLSNHDFQGAEEEFRNAHKHYRKQEYKDAIVDCLNAFESTMKTIYKKSGWSYSDKASARELIKTMFDNELIPKYLESHFTSLKSVLESGVPTVRNKTSGHGQGEFPVDVPEYLAAYVLHLTASNIVLLVEAYQNKKNN